jgi:hypothetical protein
MPTIATHPPSFESIEAEASHEKPIFIGVCEAVVVGMKPTLRFSGPIRRVVSHSYVPMKRRVRPIRDLGDMPVLDRVVMDVIDMMFHVIVIRNHMFPIPALPEAALSFCDA